MTYELFLNLMKTEGFGNFSFLVSDSQGTISCSLGVAIYEYKLMYWILVGNDIHQYEQLDAMLEAPVFFDKKIKDAWDSFEIISINEQLEEDYLSANDHFNIYEYQTKLGQLIWEYKPSVYQIYLYMIKIALIPLLSLNLIPLIIVLTGNANWFLMIFFGSITLLTFILFLIFGVRKNLNLHYYATDKGIYKEMGVMNYFAELANIKRLKLRRSIFNKNNGSIKVYVKKGLSLNYHLEGIKNIDDHFKIVKQIHDSFKEREE